MAVQRKKIWIPTEIIKQVRHDLNLRNPEIVDKKLSDAQYIICACGHAGGHTVEITKKKVKYAIQIKP